MVAVKFETGTYVKWQMPDGWHVGKILHGGTKEILVETEKYGKAVHRSVSKNECVPSNVLEYFLSSVI